MLDKFNANIIKVLEYILLVLSVVMCVDVFLQIILRYFTTVSISWMDELARFLLIISTMVGLPIATHQAAQLDVKYFVNLMPKTARMVVLAIVDVLTIGFYGFLINYGSTLTLQGMKTISTCMRIPMGYIYAIVPISAVLCLYFTAVHLVALIRSRGEVS